VDDLFETEMPVRYQDPRSRIVQFGIQFHQQRGLAGARPAEKQMQTLARLDAVSYRPE
jgi:hypothetical protein